MFETFHPQCYGHEVIVIDYAVYGRRHVGRCIQQADAEDLADHLGCYADVRMLLDWRCSGKTECEVRVPDPELQKATPCSKMLMMYMEASYSCVTGKYEYMCESDLHEIHIFVKKAKFSMIAIWFYVVTDGLSKV